MARIVVFDREPRRHELYCRLLLEHDLIIAGDVSGAVRKVLEAVPTPDIVLADWTSGGMKMIEQLRTIAERNPGFTPPPIILMDDLREPAKLDAMTRKACQHGAADFLPRQLPREIFAGRIAGFLSSDESAYQDEEDNEEKGDSPFTTIAELAGGWPVLDTILEQVGIRESKEEMDRLRKIIVDWASLPASARYREAAEYYSAFGQNRFTKLANVLYGIADAMLFQHGPVGDDEPSTT